MKVGNVFAKKLKQVAGLINTFMEQKTLEQLDYFRIRDSIARYCMTEEGKSCLMMRIPFIEKKETILAKKEAKEWESYLLSGNPNILKRWNPVTPIFPLLSVEGATIELEQAYALGQFCRATITIKQSLQIKQDGVSTLENLSLPTLRNLAEDLPDLNVAEAEIFKIIDNSGAMRDLPSIREIRASIASIRNSIEKLIKSYTNDSKLQDALQSNVPALRGNRQVLAVKANFKGRFKGIVHEVSQTGQTVYIEPDDIVQRNNDLIQEEFRLSQEVRRILKELTAKLAEHKELFEIAHTTMLRFDCAYASARWGIDNKGTYALDCTKSENLSLIQARHPLLGEKAVPIDVHFHGDYRVLILTGPNTGGKTVTLKTVALFCMLNQSGFPILANEGSRLPYFTSVFADIGDEQSLDNSLSTFSAHMKNIGEMTNRANDTSLILLDELGSGTDPQEGAAISMAVLDTLIERNSFVLCTTHQGVLKNYGYTNATCINASVEFNEQTLRPTYRVLMGVPGESHALDIAQKSGLSEAIVEKAQRYMQNGQADVSALIKGLNEKYEELSKTEIDFKKKEQYINDKYRKVDLKDLKLRQKELELKEQGYKKGQKFLDENRKMLENLVRELREGEITREKTIKVKQAIDEMEKELSTEKESLKGDKEQLSTIKNQNKETSTKEEFEKGAEVWVGETKQRGFIVSKLKKNSYLVQVGSLKLTVKETNLQLAPVSSVKLSPSIVVEMDQTSSRKSNGGKSSSPVDRPKFELRLLGMRREEALKTLERQLDLCVLYDLTTFSIVHGTGNGVLQEAVKEYLSGLGGKAEFHFARPEDGGTGKTYVTLR